MITRNKAFIAMLFFAVVTVYTAHALRLFRRQVKEYNDNSVSSYVAEFDDMLDGLRSINQGMTVNNLAMKTLPLKSSTESKTIEAEYILRELILIQTPDYGMTMICKPETDYILYHYGENVSSNALFLQQSAFMHQFKNMISDSSRYVYNQWLLYQEFCWALNYAPRMGAPGSMRASGPGKAAILHKNDASFLEGAFGKTTPL